MKRPTTALIDGDVLVYNIGFGCEKNLHRVHYIDGDGQPNHEDVHLVEEIKLLQDELAAVGYECTGVEKHIDKEVAPPWAAGARLDAKIKSILDATGCTEYDIFLSPSRTFRYDLYPEYKISRKDAPKPVHYKYLRESMEWNHYAEVVQDIEADDALGLAQTKDTVICTNDKDLKMVPGWHFNPFADDQELQSRTAKQCDVAFFRQILTGDRSDDIPGIKGLGDGTALKLIPDGTTPTAAWRIVKEQYRKYGKYGYRMLCTIADLLFIQHARGEKQYTHYSQLYTFMPTPHLEKQDG